VVDNEKIRVLLEEESSLTIEEDIVSSDDKAIKEGLLTEDT